MASKSKEKVFYRVTFSNEQSGDTELYQVCARHVSASDLYGLLEVSGFIFPEHQIVYDLGQERLKKEFGDVKRTWIPYHAIVRIDEVPDGADSEMKVVSLDAVRKSGVARRVGKPE